MPATTRQLHALKQYEATLATGWRRWAEYHERQAEAARLAGKPGRARYHASKAKSYRVSIETQLAS